LLESIATCEKKVFAAWLPICKVNYPWMKVEMLIQFGVSLWLSWIVITKLIKMRKDYIQVNHWKFSG
jgi:hypothetical protein